jgi:hypothetical protein
LAHDTSVGVLIVYVVDGEIELVATAWTSFAEICCHFVASVGFVASAGRALAFVGALKCSRRRGKFADNVAGRVTETRDVVAARAPVDGNRVAPARTTPSANVSLRCRITVPGY